MSLLKTILDVHLQLVAKEKTISRTTLLFVVRDYIGVTPVESLRATVMGDLERIWTGLRKPEALEGIEMEAVLGFAFAFLPHKILKPSQFDEAVSLLAGRFNAGEDSLFPSTPSDKIVPADGLSFYMRSIWEKIVDNKDLDLPNQQELLAQYRCDELATEAFQSMATAAEPLLSKKAQFNAGFGAACNLLKQDCLGVFSGVAYRYATEVFQRKLLELAQRIDAFLYPAFTAQLQSLKTSLMGAFERSTKELLAKKDLKASAFAKAVCESSETLLAEFEAKATSAILNGSNWSTSDFARELADELQLLSSKAKEQRCHQELDKATAKANTHLIESCSVEKLSCDEPASLVQGVVAEILGEAKEGFEELRTADLLTTSQQSEQMSSFTSSLKVMLKGHVLAEANIKAVVRQIFEEAFRYDEAGRPRVWSAADNLDAAFDAAKDKAMAALDQLQRLQIGDEALEILDGKRHDALSASLSRHFETVFLDAKRSTLTQATSIPPWIYLLILFLGWNEFMAVLHNPLYLVLAILALSAWFLTGALGVRGMLEAQVRAQLTQVYNAVFSGEGTSTSSPTLKTKANQ
jgi:hypothetical protein